MEQMNIQFKSYEKSPTRQPQTEKPSKSRKANHQVEDKLHADHANEQDSLLMMYANSMSTK